MTRTLTALVIAAALCACEAPLELDQRTGAVYFGTEDPTHVPLTPGQVMAVGYFGGCSGSLIAPTWALTARHCGIGPGDSFCMGAVADQPNLCVSVSDSMNAPSGGDMTLVELGRDAREVAPDVEPIPVLEVDLDASWLGKTAEAAGYGETETGGYGKRLFTAEPIVDVSGDELTIDGEGQHGVCFGDSGGPVMVIAADGGARVAGALSWGDPSCVGRDHYTRVDTYRDFIEENVGTTFTIGHNEVVGPMTVEPVHVSATVVDGASVTLHWSVAGGAFNAVPMTAAAAEFHGEIPAQKAGSLIEYYFDATFDGSSQTSPKRAPRNLYGFWVGELQPVFFDDFETDTDWTHGIDFGGGEGADDWQRGTPLGKGGDPNVAYSGVNVWGNDLGGGTWNGMYQSGVMNWLVSPEIDCRGCRGARLQYRRWLGVEDGQYDRARILVNDTVVWENESSSSGDLHRRDAHWSFHDIDISEAADGKLVTLRFEMNSDSDVEFGGWTIDDVSVVVNSVSQKDEPPGCSCRVQPSSPVRGVWVVLLLALGAIGIQRARRRRDDFPD